MKKCTYLIGLFCMLSLTGCKKLIEEMMTPRWGYKYSYNVNEQHIEDEVYRSGSLIYDTHLLEIEKSITKDKFVLVFDFTHIYLDNKFYKTDYTLQGKIRLKGWPEEGKKYEFSKDWNDVSNGEGCWFRLISGCELADYVDTLQIDESLRKRWALIDARTKGKGYIVFDKVRLARTENKSTYTGKVEGRFEFEADGTNECYPEINKHFTVTDGSFGIAMSEGIELTKQCDESWPDSFKSCFSVFVPN